MAKGKVVFTGAEKEFMDYYGLRSMDDLPQLKEFQTASEEIGEPSSLEEVVNYELPQNGESYLAPSDEESEWTNEWYTDQ